MPKKTNTSPSKQPRKVRPATTDEAREQQLIAMAINEAERRIMDGTASSQILCHYLKLGSTREKQELKLKEKELELMEAKTAAIKAEQTNAEMYENAIAAMIRYSGHQDEDTDLY